MRSSKEVIGAIKSSGKYPVSLQNCPEKLPLIGSKINNKKRNMISIVFSIEVVFVLNRIGLQASNSKVPVKRMSITLRNSPSVSKVKNISFKPVEVRIEVVSRISCDLLNNRHWHYKYQSEIIIKQSPFDQPQVFINLLHLPLLSPQRPRDG